MHHVFAVLKYRARKELQVVLSYFCALILNNLILDIADVISHFRTNEVIR